MPSDYQFTPNSGGFDVGKFRVGLSLILPSAVRVWRSILSKPPDKRTKEELARVDFTFPSQHIEFFRSLTETQRRALLRIATLQDFKEGKKLYRQGVKDGKFFVILEGACELRVRTRVALEGGNDSRRLRSLGLAADLEEDTLRRVTALQSAGISALHAEHGPRDGTLVATERTLALCITRGEYIEAISAWQERSCAARLRFLRALPLFASCGWSDAKLASLARAMSTREYPPRSLVMRQGDQCHKEEGFCMVLRGEVEMLMELSLDAAHPGDDGADPLTGDYRVDRYGNLVVGNGDAAAAAAAEMLEAPSPGARSPASTASPSAAAAAAAAAAPSTEAAAAVAAAAAAAAAASEAATGNRRPYGGGGGGGPSSSNLRGGGGGGGKSVFFGADSATPRASANGGSSGGSGGPPVLNNVIVSLATFGQNTTFGEAEVMRDDFVTARHHASYMTTTTTLLYVVERADFLTFLKRDPVIARRLRANVRQCALAPAMLRQQLFQQQHWQQYKLSLVDDVVQAKRAAQRSQSLRGSPLGAAGSSGKQSSARGAEGTAAISPRPPMPRSSDRRGGGVGVGISPIRRKRGTRLRTATAGQGSSNDSRASTASSVSSFHLFTASGSSSAQPAGTGAGHSPLRPPRAGVSCSPRARARRRKACAQQAAERARALRRRARERAREQGRVVAVEEGDTPAEYFSRTFEHARSSLTRARRQKQRQQRQVSMADREEAAAAAEAEAMEGSRGAGVGGGVGGRTPRGQEMSMHDWIESLAGDRDDDADDGIVIRAGDIPGVKGANGESEGRGDGSGGSGGGGKRSGSGGGGKGNGGGSSSELSLPTLHRKAPFTQSAPMPITVRHAGSGSDGMDTTLNRHRTVSGGVGGYARRQQQQRRRRQRPRRYWSLLPAEMPVVREEAPLPPMPPLQVNSRKHRQLLRAQPSLQSYAAGVLLDPGHHSRLLQQQLKQQGSGRPPSTPDSPYALLSPSPRPTVGLTVGRRPHDLQLSLSVDRRLLLQHYNTRSGGGSGGGSGSGSGSGDGTSGGAAGAAAGGAAAPPTGVSRASALAKAEAEALAATQPRSFTRSSRFQHGKNCSDVISFAQAAPLAWQQRSERKAEAAKQRTLRAIFGDDVED